MGKLKLERRTYEDRAVRNLRKMLPKHKRVVMVSPTGSGKTVMAALLLKREPRWKRVLWLAHRYELIDQAYRTLTDVGLRCGIVMAQEERLHGPDRVDEAAPVQIASVQSARTRHMGAGFDLVVVDECHRIMANTYQAILERYPSAEALGITATPVRFDGQELGDFFAHMFVAARPSHLQENGYLSKPRAFGLRSEEQRSLEESLSVIARRGGDFSPEGLSRVLTKKALVGRIVHESQRIAPRVPKVVFTSSVRHSAALAKEFRRAGVVAEHVDASTCSKERESILGALAEGKVEVVCNVDILGEGWDLPALGAVVLARPTLSLPRYLQMVGRVQRPYGDKIPIVIDHGANVQRFNLLPGEDVPWTLRQGGLHLPSRPRFVVCEECGAFMKRAAIACQECGAERITYERPVRAELDVRLQELTRGEMEGMRQRLAQLARKHGAPDEWPDAVIGMVV